MWLASADDETYLAARSQTVIAVKQAFDAAGIAISLPGGDGESQDDDRNRRDDRRRRVGARRR